MLILKVIRCDFYCDVPSGWSEPCAGKFNCISKYVSEYYTCSSTKVDTALTTLTSDRAYLKMYYTNQLEQPVSPYSTCSDYLSQFTIRVSVVEGLTTTWFKDIYPLCLSTTTRNDCCLGTYSASDPASTSLLNFGIISVTPTSKIRLTRSVKSDPQAVFKTWFYIESMTPTPTLIPSVSPTIFSPRCPNECDPNNPFTTCCTIMDNAKSTKLLPLISSNTCLKFEIGRTEYCSNVVGTSPVIRVSIVNPPTSSFYKLQDFTSSLVFTVNLQNTGQNFALVEMINMGCNAVAVVTTGKSC